MDVHDLALDVAGLYRQIGAAIGPDTVSEPDRSTPVGPRTWWCAVHLAGHTRREWRWDEVEVQSDEPDGEVVRLPPCAGGVDPRPARPVPELAATLTATAGRDQASRRGVPGSRPPGTNLVELLTVQEGIWTSARALAAAGRHLAGHVTVDRGPLRALEALPRLVDLHGVDSAYGTRVHAVLDAHRRRARRVLGLARDVLWLGPCPTTFGEPVTVLTRDGVVRDDGGCWSLDHAAIAEGLPDPETLALAEAEGWDTRIWQRSRLALPRDELRPDVQCWACGYRRDPVEMAEMVAEHLRARVSAGGTA